jgi:hypothetical protein
MLEENELPAWLENSSYSLNGLYYPWDRAECECAQDRIDTPVFQGNLLSRKIQKLNFQPRSVQLFFCAPAHSRIGFKRIDLVHPGEIVVGEINAVSRANLKDISTSQRNDLSTNVRDRLRISQHSHEFRVDMFSIERHAYLQHPKQVSVSFWDWPDHCTIIPDQCDVRKAHRVLPASSATRKFGGTGSVTSVSPVRTKPLARRMESSGMVGEARPS